MFLSPEVASWWLTRPNELALLGPTRPAVCSNVALVVALVANCHIFSGCVQVGSLFRNRLPFSGLSCTIIGALVEAIVSLLRPGCTSLWTCFFAGSLEMIKCLLGHFHHVGVVLSDLVNFFVD